MSKKNIITLALSFMAVVLAMAQQTNLNSANLHTENKVSESRKSGQFKRITETFSDKLLVSRKVEVSVKDNGQIDYVFIKLFRDGEMTYASTFNKAAKNTIRSYYHQGKMLVMEGDEDGDGFFETFFLFDLRGRAVEAFTRSKDGIVTQFSKEKLSELKKTFVIFQE